MLHIDVPQRRHGMAPPVPVQLQSQGLRIWYSILLYSILCCPCHGISTLDAYHN